MVLREVVLGPGVGVVIRGVATVVGVVVVGEVIVAVVVGRKVRTAVGRPDGGRRVTFHAFQWAVGGERST